VFVLPNDHENFFFRLQVEQLLLSEPNNEEYADIYRSLTEVIFLPPLSSSAITSLFKEPKIPLVPLEQNFLTYAAWQVIDLTKDLLKEAPAAAPQQAQAAKGSRWGEVRPAAQAPVAAPVLPSILPPQVAQQIRAAQIRAALSGQAPAAWAVGAKCQAIYSADGEFYAATVTAVSPAGNFVVLFDAYGNSEEVCLASSTFLVIFCGGVVSKIPLRPVPMLHVS
jgi:Survival motor neuron protein (SMN)